METYFFDTYALIELVKGNPNYVKYSESVVATTQLNLIEFYYSLICDFSIDTAKTIYSKFKDTVRKIDDETIFEAMELRKKQSKRRLSYVDCICYVLAKKLNIKFLTGDKEFENLENVELVKA